MNLSKTLQEQYQQQTSAASIEFTALVLTKGIWPLKEETIPLTLPNAFQACKESFEKFFFHKYQSKTLRWIHYYGKGELKFGVSSNKIYTFQCSIYQMAVLDQFNRTKVLSKVR